jgi:hypothetical protein
MNDDIKRIAACMSEHLCIQNGVINESDNPVDLAELGMENEEGDLGAKLKSLGFERVQKTPEIVGYGMKVSGGNYLVIWDNEDTSEEGQWSIIAGSEVQPAEEEVDSFNMTPDQTRELESEYVADAEWEMGREDGVSDQVPRVAPQAT